MAGAEPRRGHGGRQGAAGVLQPPTPARKPRTGAPRFRPPSPPLPPLPAAMAAVPGPGPPSPPHPERPSGRVAAAAILEEGKAVRAERAGPPRGSGRGRGAAMAAAKPGGAGGTNLLFASSATEFNFTVPFIPVSQAPAAPPGPALLAGGRVVRGAGGRGGCAGPGGAGLLRSAPPVNGLCGRPGPQEPGRGLPRGAGGPAGGWAGTCRLDRVFPPQGSPSRGHCPAPAPQEPQTAGDVYVLGTRGLDLCPARRGGCRYWGLG